MGIPPNCILPRRSLDISRARERIGFEANTDFREGIQRTIDYFIDNREAIQALEVQQA